jgi:hypothetical protein
MGVLREQSRAAPAPRARLPLTQSILHGERKQLGSIAIGRKNFVFRYRSAAHWLEVFRTFYGPMQKAFGAVDPARQDVLAADLIALAERFNRATDGTLVAPGEYVEVVITRA